MTGPYGHAGTYETLEQVVDHYSNPTRAVRNFLDNNAWCDLPQFEGITPQCTAVFPRADLASAAAIDAMKADRVAGISLFTNANLSSSETAQLVAFLQALTDPCLESTECLANWLPETGDRGPDGNQLQANFGDSP